MTNSNLIISADNNGIFNITLNCPDKLNALSQETLEALSEVFDKAKTDAAIKAICITGTGKAFCAGADIKKLAACDAETGYDFARQGQAVFNQLENLGKPSLAAINGYAFGGGCELAMAATIRLASTQAQFGQPEVKLGIMPGYGGTQRLSRLVGKGRAIDLCVTGRTISADIAYQWGLVTALVEPDNLISTAHETLQSILNNGPFAVKSTI